ncbi:MAG: extracellular solute-binding protein [Candidatus Eisenbacteria bacterium]|uniref:Extracellular solute-binding protein n=1 Tax=Eiseniibacteriota bacterium TaxID=2212470 RepID=A0A933SEH3_UNCEI|nr:extracellular solute-binding protein [Candidatus Eisenbacteria bacterium]
MFRSLTSRAPRLLASLLLCLALVPSCAPKKAATGPAKIVIWSQMDPEERARFEKNIAAYQAAHPGVTIENVPYDTENLRQQFQTAAAGGGGPQLIFGPSDQVGPLSLLELIRPLDETMPKGFFERFVPQALDTLNGHLWAAPDQVGNHLLLCYNKKLVPVPPTNAEEFLAIAKKLTKDGAYGFAMNVTEPYWLAPFLAGYDGWVFGADGKPTLDTPAMRDALNYLADLKNKQGVMPRECDYQVAETLFLEGKAAMIVNGPWSWAAYRKGGIDLGIAPLWVLPNGKHAMPMTASKGYSISVNVPKEQLDAVIDFVTYCTSPEAELRDAVALGVLPSHKDAWNAPEITADPTLKISQDAFTLGRRMPVVPEMRVVWDVMRPGLQKVMNGSMDAAKATREMQAAAEQQIAGMKR